MPTFEVDWSYKTEVYGTDIIEAADKDTAEDMVAQNVRDANPDGYGVEIDAVREVKNGG